MSKKQEETYRLAGGITVTDDDLEADVQRFEAGECDEAWKAVSYTHLDVYKRQSLADAVDRAAEIAEAGAEPADRSGVLVFGSVMLAGEMLALAGHSPR